MSRQEYEPLTRFGDLEIGRKLVAKRPGVIGLCGARRRGFRADYRSGALELPRTRPTSLARVVLQLSVES